MNRRTVKVDLSQEVVEPNPLLLARLKASTAKQILGTPMQARLNSNSPNSKQAGGSNAMFVPAAVGGTAAAVSIFLGAINSSAALLTGGTAGVAAALIWAYSIHKKQSNARALMSAPSVEWVSTDELARLESVFEQLVSVCNEETIQLVCQLKETVTRSLDLIAIASVDLHDDRFFLRETVRRYIPDSAAAWLSVPSHSRESLALENGLTATATLNLQLTKLEQELLRREKRLNVAAGESLLQQQRFIDSKTGAKS